MKKSNASSEKRNAVGMWKGQSLAELTPDQLRTVAGGAGTLVCIRDVTNNEPLGCKRD